MRNLAIYLSALSVLSPSTSALRHGASQLRDVLAFPKYEVQFLNDLPLAESDARRCRSLGIEREEEWMGLRAPFVDGRRLGDGNEQVPSEHRLELVPMSLTPPGTDWEPQPYLCLMPSENSTAAQTSQAEREDREDEEPDPVQSWSALSHLDGKCLYSKQGWFTYAYCHDSHIRQFREARHAHPHPASGYTPEEDPNFDAYTLGQAHAHPKKAKSLPGHSVQGGKPGKPTTSVDRARADEHSISPGLGASTRYLVQRWSDGTRCDKTGRPREIEVQVHCSMTTNDMIYMVKEMAICQYVIIIHSPHLCSLPGFKADLKLDVEPAPIRCRQVLRDDDFERWANGDEQGHGGWAPKMEVPLRTVGHGSGSGSGDERASLRELLAKAMGSIGDKEEVRQGNEAAGEDVGGGQGQGDHDDDDHVPLDGEEIVFISLEDLAEGDGGPVVIDADFLAGGEGLRDRLGAADRQMILGLVKEYLERKSGGDRPDATSDGDGESDGKEDKRKRDEL